MANNNAGTTQPFHDNYTSVGSSTAFTAATNNDTVITQAFRHSQLVGGSAAFSTWQQSGYEFYQRVAPTVVPTELAQLVMQDIPTLIITYMPVDSVVMQDLPNAQGPVNTTDAAVMQDIPVLKILITPPVDSVIMQDFPTQVAHQFLNPIDSVSMYDDLNLVQMQIRVGPFTVLDTMKADSVAMQDLPHLSLVLPPRDSVVMQDLPKMRRNVNAKFSTAIEVVKQVKAKFSTEIQVAHYFPTPINVVGGDYPYTSPPGGPTAPTVNPTDPSVVFGGVPAYLGSTTVRSGSSSYYSFLESQIAPNCDLVNFNLSMGIGVGSFSIETQGVHPAGLGQVFTLLGIQCVVTKKGRTRANKDTWTISGLVGDSRFLNKQILLTLDLSQVRGLGPLAPNTPLQSPSVLQWTSVAEAARAISGAAGVSLTWYAKDAPLIDTFLESGQTVGESLRSLASRVGALMSFDGFRSWNVFTPDQGFGGWAGLAGCNFLGQGGIQQFSEIDIADSVVQIAVQPGSNSTVTYIANPLAINKPLVTPMYTTRSIIKSAKLPEPIQIPGDFKDSWIQIVIDPDSISGSDSDAIMSPNIPVSATAAGLTYGSNSITSPGVAPPKVVSPWRKYSFPIVADDVGNHFLMLTNNDFPPYLIDGKFTLRVGYSRDEAAVANVYQKNFEEAVQRNRLYLQYQQEAIRYFPDSSTQIQFKFNGSLPMPGNRTTFFIDGFLIDGIVDSVNMTRDYDVTVGITHYTKINFLDPKAQLDYFGATGQLAP